MGAVSKWAESEPEELQSSIFLFNDTTLHKHFCVFLLFVMNDQWKKYSDPPDPT